MWTLCLGRIRVSVFFPAPEVQSSGDGGGGKSAGSHVGAVREGVTWWYLEQHWDAAVHWSNAPWGSCWEGIFRERRLANMCWGSHFYLEISCR